MSLTNKGNLFLSKGNPTILTNLLPVGNWNRPVYDTVKKISKDFQEITAGDDNFKNIYNLCSPPKYFEVILKVTDFSAKHTIICRQLHNYLEDHSKISLLFKSDR